MSRGGALDNPAYDFEEDDLDLDVTVEDNSSKTEIIVEISTGPKGRLGSLGFKIAGGKDKPCVPGDPGIFIQRVKQGSPVHGILKTGDKILKIDGFSVLNVHRHRALDLIKSADRKVKLVVKKTQKSEYEVLEKTKQNVICFNAEQLEEFEAAFSAHDHGMGGKIYCRELKPLCRSLGHNLTSMELEEIVTELSLTGDRAGFIAMFCSHCGQSAQQNDKFCANCGKDKRKINFDDFIAVMVKISEMENKKLDEDLHQAFEVFDREKKGYFKVSELLNALNYMPGAVKVSRSEIAEILYKSDENKDGLIQFKDFKKLVLPAFSLQYNT